MIVSGDQWIQYPIKDLYDKQLMAMSINAARDMYEKGQQEIKDFRKEYGDFITPILADQDWYNENVTGKVRDTINTLYQNGIDPIRSAEGRAVISSLINSIPIGEVAKLRSSAENAKEFLKARKALEAQGLYNPLFAKYDGPDINTYSTVDQGIWDKMSPTKIVDMATFGNPYYEGLKANRKKVSKGGKEYNVEEINMSDLRNIANSKFNELVSTPQGQLMYKYYMDQTENNPELAREMFNQAVADGQKRRIYKYEEEDDNYFKNEQLKISRAQLAIQQKKLKLLEDKQKKADELKAKGWTHRQFYNIMVNGKKSEDASKFGGQKGVSIKDRNDFARNYSAYQTKLVPGSHDMNTARALFSGLTSPVGIADFEIIKRNPVSFTSGSGLNFTAHRQYAYGGREITSGSASNKLLNYMRQKRLQGYVVYDVWDINGYVRVKKEDLDGFDGDLNQALKLIGATEYKVTHNAGTKNKPRKEKIVYVDIPVSRTIDSRGYSDSEIDMLGDGLNLTKSATVKRQPYYEDSALEDAYED